MAAMWKKTLHFLGLVEDYEDEYADLPEEAPAARTAEPTPARADPSNVRRIPSAQSAAAPAAPAAVSAAVGALSAAGGAPPYGGASTPTVRHVPQQAVHLTNPTTFNDVEEVGERFRGGVPVIMNLQGADEGVAKRLLDFASGLIYGLDGRIERVGDRVFLLTPTGVDVSSEERARLSERGFFNQA